MNKHIHDFLRGCKRIVKTPFKIREIAKSKKKKGIILNKKRAKERSNIKIGFIVQMPEVWDKEAPLFEALIRDNRFDVFLIIVPHYDFSRSKLSQYGAEKQYFTKKYPDVKTVLLKNENDMVIDDSYDYIFYQRCWEQYLPKQLRCKNVINYAMTCYIPYCYHCTPMHVSYYENSFFWYLNKFYSCSEDQLNQVNEIGNIECQYLGFPVIDSLHYSFSSRNKINILWTPRWTDDQSLGGTSFNDNKYKVLELLNQSNRISLYLRPHPLTFENAIKQKWMSEEEVQEYKKLVVESGAYFDSNELIEDTFVNTDILITDFTSAILTYFLSGRPIIYCAGRDFAMTGTFQEIIDSLYIAQDWNEVQGYITKLVNGNDPLGPKRQLVINKITNNESSVEKITEDLFMSLTDKEVNTWQQQ